LNVETKVDAGGLGLATPVVLASGCAGYGDEWLGLVNLDAVGAVVLKGVSLEPWTGNPPPRIAEAPAGVINAVGLENVGLDALVKEKLPALGDLPCKVVANVVGRSREEYRDVCAALVTSGLSRWHNYYLEGLAWLLRNVEIDGLYLDDVGYDRVVMQRVRKVLDRTRPGCLLDFHSWNHFNARAGYANCLNLYLEHLPSLSQIFWARQDRRQLGMASLPPSSLESALPVGSI